MRPTRALTAAVLLLGVAATACNSAVADEPDVTSPPVVAVETIDYEYRGLPATVTAGTTLTITNTSDAELHELVAIRLPDDEMRTVAEIVASPDLASFFPSVAAVLIAPPGEAGIAVEGTGTLTEPGRYVIICAIPTGADPAEYLAAAAEAEGGPPEVAGGPPHFVVGMYGEIVVEG